MKFYILEEIKNNLEKNKDFIISILKEIENESVALEEYKLALLALENNRKYGNKKVKMISSYLPMNLPLYSLMLYSIVPSVCSSKSYYRPSTYTLSQSKKIHNILNLNDYNINLYERTRYEYLTKCVVYSDVVIFVGNPNNAAQVSKAISNNTMFIYFGVGQNPVVISDNANIDIASKKIAETVMFNYGQDCSKPNIILCKENLSSEFINKLIKEIESNIKQKTTIKKSDMLVDVSRLLIRDSNHIVLGGEIDFKNKTMNPIVIVKKITDDPHNYEEFYAPIFRVMIYSDISDLKKYFSRSEYKQENMNISLFGESDFIESIPESLVLHNEMVPEIDTGFCEFGGYGENTSYILYKGVKIRKPILINREIENFYENSNFDELKDGSEKTKIKKVMIREYTNTISKIFDNNLNFSFVFGSYAKGKEKLLSDLDMLVCLKEPSAKAIEEFTQWYFKLHYAYGKIPDFVYPGEIITDEHIIGIINNNKNIEFNLKNPSEVFDAVFYTQIFTDRKISILGDKEKLLNYELQLRKYVPNFCNQIFELLKKHDKINSERDYMKCLIALSNNDLLFFAKRLEYENLNCRYDKIIEKLDDGFLVKCLKRKI